MREPLDREALHATLVTPGSPWTRIDLHPSLGSTNAEASRLGEPWRVVLTDHQTAGRGRLGRTWETPGNTAVTLSVLMPTPADVRGWMPLVTGLAVLRGLDELTGLRAGLKWPNDVLLAEDDERKVCGVLCELHPDGVVVGLGVNVEQTRDELPVPTATSLRLAGANQTTREQVVVAVLRQLASAHADLCAGGPARAAVQSAYRDTCLTVGRDVDLHAVDGRVERVRAVGVDAQGRLVVEAGGAQRAVAAGDVVHVRVPGVA